MKHKKYIKSVNEWETFYKKSEEPEISIPDKLANLQTEIDDINSKPIDKENYDRIVNVMIGLQKLGQILSTFHDSQLDKSFSDTLMSGTSCLLKFVKLAESKVHKVNEINSYEQRFIKEVEIIADKYLEEGMSPDTIANALLSVRATYTTKGILQRNPNIVGYQPTDKLTSEPPQGTQKI